MFPVGQAQNPLTGRGCWFGKEVSWVGGLCTRAAAMRLRGLLSFWGSAFDQGAQEIQVWLAILKKKCRSVSLARPKEPYSRGFIS